MKKKVVSEIDYKHLLKAVKFLSVTLAIVTISWIYGRYIDTCDCSRLETELFDSLSVISFHMQGVDALSSDHNHILPVFDSGLFVAELKVCGQTFYVNLSSGVLMSEEFNPDSLQMNHLYRRISIEQIGVTKNYVNEELDEHDATDSLKSDVFSFALKEFVKALIGNLSGAKELSQKAVNTGRKINYSIRHEQYVKALRDWLQKDKTVFSIRRESMKRVYLESCLLQVNDSAMFWNERARALYFSEIFWINIEPATENARRALLSGGLIESQEEYTRALLALRTAFIPDPIWVRKNQYNYLLQSIENWSRIVIKNGSHTNLLWYYLDSTKSESAKYQKHGSRESFRKFLEERKSKPANRHADSLLFDYIDFKDSIARDELLLSIVDCDDGSQYNRCWNTLMEKRFEKEFPKMSIYDHENGKLRNAHDSFVQVRTDEKIMYVPFDCIMFEGCTPESWSNLISKRHISRDPGKYPEQDKRGIVSIRMNVDYETFALQLY